MSLSHALYERGWMEGTSGNLSALLPAGGDLALVTASGRSKGELGPGDLVPVTIAHGQPVDPAGPRPSAETAVHTALYRSVKDCAVVVHAHPPYATALAGLAAEHGQDTLRLADYELIKGFGVDDPTRVTLPVFANRRDVSRIGEEVEAHFLAEPDNAPPALLIAHHGATVWGPDPETARNRLECLEGVCRLVLLTRDRA